MKRKTFFKALAGVIIAPTLLAKIVPKKQYYTQGIVGFIKKNNNTEFSYTQIVKTVVDITEESEWERKRKLALRKYLMGTKTKISIKKIIK
ncbi:MAG: hypothetical protein GY804_04550 [Alphaproteobacteria bacterium]|nr:hypothetical protein [Alphaproteobacteria bacterium]